MSEFKQKYEEINQALQGDHSLDERVLAAMAKEAAPARKNTHALRRVLAMAACLALLIATGVLFYTPTRQLPTQNVHHATYADVYSVIRQLQTESVSLYGGMVERVVAVDLADDVQYDAALTEPEGANSAAQYTGKDAAAPSGNYSETTHQVIGVEEGDVVKTDGRYIYRLSGTQLFIFAVDGEQIEQLSATELGGSYAAEMYVAGDTLVLLANPDWDHTAICVYDISDRTAPQKRAELSQSGYFLTSRLADGQLVTVSNYYVDIEDAVKSQPETYVPVLGADGKNAAVKEDCLTIAGDPSGASYVVVTAVRLDQPEQFHTARAVLGCGGTVYMNRQNLYLGWSSWQDNYEKTRLLRLAVGDGTLDVKAEGSVPGQLLNQFSMDEYDGHLRVVTTTRGTTKNEGVSTLDGKVVYEGVVVDDVREVMPVGVVSGTAAALYVLDEDLAVTGKIEDLAPGERVYSVRFDGTVGYFVTFRQTDPLFSADLSDPANPRILGELKIPGFSNYLYPYGEGLLLGFGQEDGSVKMSMFDISDPANVTEIAKLVVEGGYSNAQYNHKAMLADPVKNLIGFASERFVLSGNGDEYRWCSCYLLYRFENGAFVPVKELDTQLNFGNDARGLYIGDWFYVVADRFILPLSLQELRVGETFLFEGYAPDDPSEPWVVIDIDDPVVIEDPVFDGAYMEIYYGDAPGFTVQDTELTLEVLEVLLDSVHNGQPTEPDTQFDWEQTWTVSIYQANGDEVQKSYKCLFDASNGGVLLLSEEHSEVCCCLTTEQCETILQYLNKYRDDLLADNPPEPDPATTPTAGPVEAE